ncbi:XrtX-associated membrane protein [uncultured Hymenobacter sp.]|uniref:XrtX-associated membrane protein n=1 Tax=uncultured Hymenobacter sp. TaxID=170016 RepID=UPI0035C94A64
MPELVKPAFSLSPSRRRVVNNLVRAVAVAGLVLLLFWFGTYDLAVFGALNAGWQKLFDTLGLTDQLAAIQRGVSGQVTRRSLPTMLTYSLLYTSTCLLLLRLLLPRGGHRMRWACLLYAAVFVACGLLLVGGKLAGDAVWAYRLGRRLIDFIVSPIPVIILVPLLRWYVSPKQQ